MNMKRASWEEVSDFAEKICQVRASDIDLVWAKQAWDILSDTPLCEYSNEMEYKLIKIRLFCIAEIIHIYNYLSMDETFDANYSYYEWLDESGIQKIEIVILAGEEYYFDSYIEEDGEICEVISYLIETQYDMIVKWLIKGFGSKDKMMESLESPLGTEENSFTYDEAISAGMNPDTVYTSIETLKLIDWKDKAFPRNFA